MKVYDQGQIIQFAALGSVVGLFSLARFNAVPLIVTFIILLPFVLKHQKAQAGRWVFSVGAFLIPYLLVINAWCLYNYYNNGFYGLFPRTGLEVPRNVTVASIRPENTVSGANKPVLDIFVSARAEYLSSALPQIKGSFKEYDRFGILSGLYDGYAIYGLAAPKLRKFYNLPEQSGEYELSANLAGFYREIPAQNKAYISKFRFFSLLSSFRASSGGALPEKYGKINLNILPPFAFKVYKVGFLFISFSVFIAFFFFIGNGIKNAWHFDFTLLTMFLIVFSFWGINFVFVTENDANRYKFPAAPFIIGLFVYYVMRAANLIYRKAPPPA